MNIVKQKLFPDLSGVQTILCIKASNEMSSAQKKSPPLPSFSRAACGLWSVRLRPIQPVGVSATKRLNTSKTDAKGMSALRTQ